jgi:hypothetical protein
MFRVVPVLLFQLRLQGYQLEYWNGCANVGEQHSKMSDNDMALEAMVACKTEERKQTRDMKLG